MGLLDEAIRQHLDLKRRRGADPAEIEQAEREALGPTRRGGEDPDQVAFDQELAGVSDEELAVPPDYQPDSGSELEGVEEQEGWSEPFNRGPSDREPPDQEPFDQEAFDQATEIITPQEEQRLRDEDPLERFDVPDDPSSHPASASPAPEPAESEGQMAPPVSPEARPEDHLGQETEEYDVELDREENGEEAMLEETPEFLQDTPEHDRLWFEQRPPRDFDFDG